MERQIQDEWRSARIAIVSRQCLYENCLQIIEKNNNGHLVTFQIGIPWTYRAWGVTHETILKPSEAPKQLSNLKSLWRIYGTIFRRSNLQTYSRVLEIV